MSAEGTKTDEELERARRTTRPALATALAEAVRQWTPYEQVHTSAVKGEHGGVKFVLKCRHCKATGRNADEVNHKDDCPYGQAKDTLDSCREEGLLI